MVLVLVGLGIAIGCSLAACADALLKDKAAPEVWAGLAGGRQQDLLLVFDDAQIQAQAAQRNKARGIQFDDSETQRFKAQAFAAAKQVALSSLPASEVEVLKDYEALPLLHLRIRSASALRALLALPSVLRAEQDRTERLIR